MSFNPSSFYIYCLAISLFLHKLHREQVVYIHCFLSFTFHMLPNLMQLGLVHPQLHPNPSCGSRQWFLLNPVGLSFVLTSFGLSSIRPWHYLSVGYSCPQASWHCLLLVFFLLCLFLHRLFCRGISCLSAVGFRVLSKSLFSPSSIDFSLGDLMPNFQISNPDLSWSSDL